MFRTLFFSSLLFSLINACNTNHPQNTSSVEIKDSIFIDTPSYSIALLEGLEKEEKLDEATLIRPNGYSFIGTIDNQYSIEMSLIPTKISSKNCQSLIGHYFYTSTQTPIALDGKICFEEQTINLQHFKEKNKDIEERFEGTFINNLSAIQGTWIKTKKKQQLPFQLHNLMTSRNTTLFVTALASILGDDIEAPSSQTIDYDQQGVYIESLSGPHLVYDFYPGNFSASTSYSSTMRSSSYEINVYLKKLSIKDQYVAVTSYEHYNEHYEEGKDGEAIPEVSKEKIYEVWMYQGDEIINIFIPKKSITQSPIYATLKDNILTIIDQNSQKEQKLQ